MVRPHKCTRAARLKAINEVYFQYLKNNDKEIFIENFLLIDSIANICIKEGGYATLRARFLMDLVQEEQEYDDDISCNLPELLILNNEEIISGERLSIYPNPAKGVFYLKALDQTVISELLVLDIHGRQYNSKIDFTNHVAKVSISLPSGWYLVKALLEDNRVMLSKLMVNE